MLKSIKELECELKRLKDSYEICGLDLSVLKKSFHSYVYSRCLLNRNKNKDDSSLINRHNIILESTKEAYIKYNRILRIERKIREKRRQFSNKNESTLCSLSTDTIVNNNNSIEYDSNKNESTLCSLSTDTIVNNNNSIEYDSQPNTNIIVEIGHTSDNTSSNDPIELCQQFENNNVTTNGHNDNNYVRTSYTYDNQIEDLPHQNNNADQIINEDDLFHD